MGSTMRRRRVGGAAIVAAVIGAFATVAPGASVHAQVAPTKAEQAAYRGLHAAAAKGDVAGIRRLLARRSNPNAVDAYGRTPAHVAAFFKRRTALAELLKGGTDPNALERDKYDVVTIAAVANDPETIKVALKYGARPDNITSIYVGNALIAASHLGNVEAVRTLIAAGAELDHVNNLHWTALIEAIVLGDGGARHTEVVRMLVAAGADMNLMDRSGQTPLQLAEGRGYSSIAQILRSAGAR
jgi:uncharacterized protein